MTVKAIGARRAVRGDGQRYVSAFGNLFVVRPGKLTTYDWAVQDSDGYFQVRAGETCAQALERHLDDLVERDKHSFYR